MELTCYACHISGMGHSRGSQPGAGPAAKTSFPMESSPPNWWWFLVLFCHVMWGDWTGLDWTGLDWTAASNSPVSLIYFGQVSEREQMGMNGKGFT